MINVTDIFNFINDNSGLAKYEAYIRTIPILQW